MKNKQKKDRYIIYMNIIYIIYLYVRIRVHTKSVYTFYDKEERGARAVYYRYCTRAERKQND